MTDDYDGPVSARPDDSDEAGEAPDILEDFHGALNGGWLIDARPRSEDGTGHLMAPRCLSPLCHEETGGITKVVSSKNERGELTRTAAQGALEQMGQGGRGLGLKSAGNDVFKMALVVGGYDEVPPVFQTGENWRLVPTADGKNYAAGETDNWLDGPPAGVSRPPSRGRGGPAASYSAGSVGRPGAGPGLREASEFSSSAGGCPGPGAAAPGPETRGWAR